MHRLLVLVRKSTTSSTFRKSQQTDCIGKMSEPHTEAVTSMIFDSSSAFLITAGDKHVRFEKYSLEVDNQEHCRVFHNVPGKQMQIEDLKVQLKRNLSNSTAKARIEGLIR